jgi:hypothetical protein
MQQFNVTISLFNIIRGPLGTAADSVCNGEVQGGDWCNIDNFKCENDCGGKWCTNELISIETIPSEPIDNACGYGQRGNGTCPKQGECCSDYGWCGVSSDHCGFTPTSTPTSDHITLTASTGAVIENQCVICPNGPSTSLDDYAPYATNGDGRTCAELLQDALTIESGTEDCGWAELNDGVECCYSEPVNPCIICPDGVTASPGEEYVPDYGDNTATCADLIAGAMRFESGSAACALYDVDAGFCCPPGMTTPPTSTPTTTRVTTSQQSKSHPQSNAPTPQKSNSHPPSNPGEEDSTSEVVSVTAERQSTVSNLAIVISFLAGISLMALVIYYLRKRASTIQVRPREGGVTTAAALPIDPEIGPEAVIRTPSLWQMTMRPQNTDAPDSK